VSVRKTIIATILVAQLWSVGCSDRREASFATPKEARNAGAVAKGWIPGDLPDSATELREVHDVDTNEVWGTFRLYTNEPGTIGLSRIEASRINGHSVRAPRVTWWPEKLSGSLDARSLEKDGFELYAARGQTEFWIAINQQTHQGFFWSTR
jgi:hypothetical protein